VADDSGLLTGLSFVDGFICVRAVVADWWLVRLLFAEGGVFMPSGDAMVLLFLYYFLVVGDVSRVGHSCAFTVVTDTGCAVSVLSAQGDWCDADPLGLFRVLWPRYDWLRGLM
jgi:hypothetical protein